MASSAAEDKKILRERLLASAPPASSLWEKASENLRRLEAYRSANCIFVSLHHDLKQVRLNALVDGKRLVLPTPGLQQGFRLLEGATIPIGKRALAVSPRFLSRFGQRLSCREPVPWRVQLVITEVLAVADNGFCLGDGAGHSDLQIAILAALGWLAPTFEVAALVAPDRIAAELPAESHDVPANWIVSAEGWRPARREFAPAPAIVWERLDRRSIRRNEALFVLQGRAANPSRTSR